MPPELTPDEVKFFETGELPDALAAEHGLAPAPSPAPVDTPSPAPAPAPTPAPAPNPAPTPNPPSFPGTPAPQSPPAQAPAPSAVNDLLAQQAQQEARARLALQQQIADLTARIDQATKPAAPAAPDPQTDPLGAMMHQLNNLNEQLQALQQQQVQQQQLTQQEAEFNAFVTEVKTQRDLFQKTTPDFTDAYQHLRNARAADLRDVGVPEDRIAQTLLQDELAVAYNAKQQGKNPAEVMYNMAKRYGYAPKAAAPAPAPAAPDLSQRIAQLQQGQAAAINIPRTDGTQALTFEGLKDASGRDLDALVTNDAEWSRLVGGQSDDIF